MATNKRSTTMFERINQYLNLTVKCHLRNGKSFVGFDFHMNVVLTNSTQKSEEERQKRPQQQVCHQIREFNEFKINCEISVVQKRWTLLVDDVKTCNASLSIWKRKVTTAICFCYIIFFCLLYCRLLL